MELCRSSERIYKIDWKKYCLGSYWKVTPTIILRNIWIYPDFFYQYSFAYHFYICLHGTGSMLCFVCKKDSTNTVRHWVGFPSFTFPIKVCWFQSTFNPTDFDPNLGDIFGCQEIEAQQGDEIRRELPDSQVVQLEPEGGSFDTVSHVHFYSKATLWYCVYWVF